MELSGCGAVSVRRALCHFCVISSFRLPPLFLQHLLWFPGRLLRLLESPSGSGHEEAERAHPLPDQTVREEEARAGSPVPRAASQSEPLGVALSVLTVICANTTSNCD